MIEVDDKSASIYTMEKSSLHLLIKTEPRLIIHGGAGNITPQNLTRKSWALYKANLLRIYYSTNERLSKGDSALDAAIHAVTLFEDCESFNCGKGAVSAERSAFSPASWKAEFS